MGNTPYRMDYRRNLGTLDRIIRSAVGLGLVLLGYFSAISRGWGTAVIVFGVFLMVEAAVGY